MAVYLPNAIVGNGRMLVTLGRTGEVMGLFYPRIDFPQNVHEFMLAFHFPAQGHLCWTFQECWDCRQRYLGSSAPVVETVMQHHGPEMRVVLTDFVLPDEDVLVRTCAVAGAGPAATALHYLDLRLGETANKNAVHYLEEERALVQHWRDLWVAIAANPLDEYQCGRVGASSDAKQDLRDGRLGGNSQDIGNVNLAIASRVGPGASAVRFYLALGLSESEALRRLRVAREREPEALQAAVRARWARPKRMPPGLTDKAMADAFARSLTTIQLLRDREGGGLLAAPEFDPEFERSGGYGYCWPRDGAEAADALTQVGDYAAARGFFEWCARTQQENGHWGQRYWLSGELGPGWCWRPDFCQLDQTASVVWALCEWWDKAVGAGQTPEREAFSSMLRRACSALVGGLDGGVHETACDLWETFTGTFAYTSAAIYAALSGAARLGKAWGESDAALWQRAAAQVKRSAAERFRRRGRWFASATADGPPNPRADSSILGLVEPFGMLRTEVVAERRQAARVIAEVEQRLVRLTRVGPLVLRYDGDSYLGGMAGVVNTLWMARALYRLAAGEARFALEAARAHFVSAEAYLGAALACRTETGLFPELGGGGPQAPYWAAPHLWASAAFISACFRRGEALEEMGKVE